MAFAFGTKKSEAPLQATNYLRNFKKGETKTRFLQESPDWHAYYEHYMDGKSFPCMEIPECPGCRSDNESVKRRSRRYGTFVYLVESKQVLPFKIGSKLEQRLTVRAERNGGSLLNRDYIVIRSGAALETDYDVDQDERYEFDTASAWKQRGDLTIADILNEAFEAVFGDPEKYLANLAAESTTKPSGGDKSLGFADEKDRSSETPTVPGTKEEDAPPFDGDQEISEEQLLDMSRAQLEEIYKKAGFPDFDDDWGKRDVVAAILKHAS